MAVNIAQRLVRKQSGLATVYSCPFCKHFEKFAHGRGGGRGYGLRMGGTLHSKLAAHIRAEHPVEVERVAALREKTRVFPFSTEPERSDAMTEARLFVRELVEATKSRAWTFEFDRDRSAYVVKESLFHKERTGL